MIINAFNYLAGVNDTPAGGSKKSAPNASDLLGAGGEGKALTSTLGRVGLGGGIAGIDEASIKLDRTNSLLEQVRDSIRTARPIAGQANSLTELAHPA